MKKIILLVLTLVFVAACQEKSAERYTTTSPEIDVLTAGIDAYESGDWDKWKSHFGDNAEVYVNSKDSIGVDERIEQLKGATAALTSYGFDKKDDWMEMVLDGNDETWVYYWAQWNGQLAANNKEISIPIHLAVQFVDGKIAEEHVYYDSTELNNAMASIANMSDSDKMIQTTINNITEAWNANDKATMASSMTSKFIRTENGKTIAKSPQDYAGFMDVYHGAFPDFTVKIDNTVINDNKAYLDWTCTGTNSGKFMDNDPTNKKIKTHGFSVWTFDAEGNGLREDAFYDNLVVFNQLGITPPK